jgi:hypothetical protein
VAEHVPANTQRNLTINRHVKAVLRAIEKKHDVADVLNDVPEELEDEVRAVLKENDTYIDYLDQVDGV